MGENAGVSDYYGVGARSVEASLRRAARPSLTMTTMIRQLSPAQFSGPRPRCHHWWRLLSACCSCISVSLSESDHLTGSGHGQSRPPSIAATVWAWGGGQECVGLFPLPPSTTHTRTHTHTLHHRSRETLCASALSLIQHHRFGSISECRKLRSQGIPLSWRDESNQREREREREIGETT